MPTSGSAERRRQDGLRMWAGVLLIIIGVAVLIGWTWDVFLLTTLAVGFTPMKPITAVGLVAVGVMLLYAAPSRLQGRRPSVSVLLAFAVAAVGLEQVSEQVSQHALGRGPLPLFETTFFADQLARQGQSARMAISTAIGFVMIGIGMVFGLSRYPSVGRVAAMATVVLGYGGALGYLYEARNIYSFQGELGMAPHTAVGMFIGGVGVLVAIDSPLVKRLLTDKRPSAVLLRRVLPFAAFGLPMIGFVRLRAQRGGLMDFPVGLSAMVASSVALVGFTAWRAATEVDELNRKLEDALESTGEANIELEARVLQRTAELSDAFELQARALSDNQALLRELHHRVKNNLQVMSSLMSFQAEQHPAGSARDGFVAAQSRVHAIAAVHDQLFEVGQFAEIDLTAYAENILTDVAIAFDATDRKIGWSVSGEPLPLPADIALPCALIVSELVTNAFKHAFVGRSTGRISVRIERGPGGSCFLAVSDDGVGLEISDELPTRPKLGLDLVNTFIEQIDGDMRVYVDSGTTVTVAFELPAVIEPASLL